jgi:RND family efflux transporter MFP subunit
MTETPNHPAEYNRDQPNTNGRHTSASRLVVIWLVVFVLFAALGVYGLMHRRHVDQVLADQTVKDAVPYVAVTHAQVMNSQSDLILPGTLEAYVDSPIYARTNGYLSKWYKDIGSKVTKGELLAEIETPEIDQQLAQARADLVTAQANLGLSNTTATRYQDLIKTDSVSKQEVDNAVGDLAAKKSTVTSAEANVRRLQDLESFKHVYAPFTGVITQRNTDIGMLINAGNGGANTSLFTLAQIDPLRVFVAVPQTYAPSIHAGMKACLELQEFPGRSFCGQVTRTADAIDVSTRTLNTEVDVPNHSGTLLPGAYAQVHFDIKASVSRLALPINALLFRPEGTMVAVVGPDSRIELKHVEIGRDMGATVELVGGIDANDAIVVNPPDALDQGEPVRVDMKASQGASATAPEQGSTSDTSGTQAPAPAKGSRVPGNSRKKP